MAQAKEGRQHRKWTHFWNVCPWNGCWRRNQTSSALLSRSFSWMTCVSRPWVAPPSSTPSPSKSAAKKLTLCKLHSSTPSRKATHTQQLAMVSGSSMGQSWRVLLISQTYHQRWRAGVWWHLGIMPRWSTYNRFDLIIFLLKLFQCNAWDIRVSSHSRALPSFSPPVFCVFMLQHHPLWGILFYHRCICNV